MEVYQRKNMLQNEVPKRKPIHRNEYIFDKDVLTGEMNCAKKTVYINTTMKIQSNLLSVMKIN